MVLHGINSSNTSAPLRSRLQASIRSIKQKGLDMLPGAEFSSEKFLYRLKDIGKNFSSDKQRLVLGATAIVTQPVIDAKNKSVDEKTRKVSVARTVAKIIAGTLTGFFIRYGCIKAIKAFSQIPGKGVPKYKTIFTPKGITDNTTDAFEQYRNAMGTVIALGVMLFTNFLIDAPLTKFLTNVFTKHQETEDKK